MISETTPPSLEAPGYAAGPTVRALRMDDCEALTALANLPGFRAGTLRLPFQSNEQTRRWLEKLDDNKLGIVAVLDGTIVGSAGFVRCEGRRQHAAHIGLGVHDDYHGRGIGTALMAALIDAADNWHAIKRLELTVFSDNARAIRLYERFGFEREGLLKAYAFRAGTYADALSMARVRL